MLENVKRIPFPFHSEGTLGNGNANTPTLYHWRKGISGEPLIYSKEGGAFEWISFCDSHVK